MTLDLGVVSSRPVLGVEITEEENLLKKSINQLSGETQLQIPQGQGASLQVYAEYHKQQSTNSEHS